MRNEKCPLTPEEEKKYCLCETCLFVKQCYEEMDKLLAEMDESGNLSNGNLDGKV